MSEELLTETIQTELREKEELVAALTERLELAADQLDRYQRTGSDRHAQTSAPAGLVAETKGHTALLEDFQQMLNEQNETKSNVTLDRISDQIKNLHQLVAQQSVNVQKPDSTNLVKDASATTESSTGTLSAWAAMKEDILKGESETASENEAPAIVVTEKTEETSQHVTSPTPNITWSSLTPPEVIDFDNVDAETLQQAVNNRDEYISYLVQKLCIAETSGLPREWSETDAPKELHQKLSGLATRLEETLRVSEIEISMERARLSRENLRLQLMEQQASKVLHQLGIDINDDEIDWENLEVEEQPESGNRWLRMLGIGKES